MKLNGRQMRERGSMIRSNMVLRMNCCVQFCAPTENIESKQIEEKKNEIESNTWLHRCEHGRNKSNKIVRIIKTSCGRAGWQFGHKMGPGTGKQYISDFWTESEIGQIEFEFMNSVWWTWTSPSIPVRRQINWICKLFRQSCIASGYILMEMQFLVFRHRCSIDASPVSEFSINRFDISPLLTCLMQSTSKKIESQVAKWMLKF